MPLWQDSAPGLSKRAHNPPPDPLADGEGFATHPQEHLRVPGTAGLVSIPGICVFSPNVGSLVETLKADHLTPWKLILNVTPLLNILQAPVRRLIVKHHPIYFARL